MINTKILKGKIIMEGFTQKQLSKLLGIDERAFSLKINNKTVFNTKEIDMLCQLLKIRNDKEKIFIFLGSLSHNRDDRSLNDSKRKQWTIPKERMMKLVRSSIFRNSK
jgi:hypothetical protein